LNRCRVSGDGWRSVGRDQRLERRAPTDEAVQVMKRRNIDISGHRSRRVSPALFEWADVVLTMTEEQRAACIAAGAPERKVATVGEFAGTGKEVEDPVGQGPAAYERCARQLE
jgi:protein-tyrosine-phosphatase